MTDGSLDAYAAFRSQTRFKKVKPGDLRLVARCWNAQASSCYTWPNQPLALPPRAAGSTGLALDDFPVGLLADIDRYFEGLTHSRRDPYSERRLKACKPVTIAIRRRELVAAIRTGVAAGIPLDQLDSLPALLAPKNVATIIDAYWARDA